MESLNKLYQILIEEDSVNSTIRSYKSEMSMIVVKSLIPDQDSFGVRINYERYLKELDIWASYRNTYNSNLKEIKKISINNYFKEDDSIFFRVIPILIANKNLAIIEDEIIKNMIFTTGNLNSILYNLTIMYIFYYYLNGYDDIYENVKDKVINMSQNNFFNDYGRYYRVNLDSLDMKYKIEFEKIKVDILSSFTTFKSKCLSMEELIGVLEGKNNNLVTTEAKVFARLLEEDSEARVEPVHIDFSNYLMNLREGKISPESLYIKDYIMPDIFQFNQGESFFHSLFNNCKIIKKDEKNNQLASLVQTKTGLYLFKK